MPLTLRQHVEESDAILTTGGVKTLIPQLGRPAPVRVDAGNRLLEYALSIKLALDRCDRTGWMTLYLRCSREVSNSVWERIPEGKKGLVSADLRAMKGRLREGGIAVG